MFRPKAFELLARFTEAGIAAIITNTRRTSVQQEALLAQGNSWVERSKHQDGRAIDVCPFELYALHGPDKLQWDANDPVWQTMGRIGEMLGLRWGGRWKQRDMGHFEDVVGKTL